MDEMTLINRGLSRIGGQNIDNLQEPGASGDAVRNCWESVLEDVMSKYPWGFMSRYAALTRIGESTTSWKYEFRLPPDRLAEPRAYYNSGTSRPPVTRYELTDGKVLSDCDKMVAWYPYKSAISQWPGYFRELVVLLAAAEFAGAIREDWQLRRELRSNAYGSERFQGEGGQFAVAASLDAQAHPSPEIDGGRNPLTDTHNDGFSADDSRHGFESW